MSRTSKRDWLMEGMRVLGELGANGITIDLVAARLQVTKGSFYHHFKNYDDFKAAMLNFWVEEATLKIIDLTEQVGEPRSKIDQLLQLTISPLDYIEVAIRAWALQDELVQSYQQRVDQQRLTYLQNLCVELGYESAQALKMAQILYSLYVGSGQIGLTGSVLHDLYAEIKRLYGI